MSETSLNKLTINDLQIQAAKSAQQTGNSRSILARSDVSKKLMSFLPRYGVTAEVAAAGAAGLQNGAVVTSEQSKTPAPETTPILTVKKEVAEAVEPTDKEVRVSMEDKVIQLSKQGKPNLDVGFGDETKKEIT